MLGCFLCVGVVSPRFDQKKNGLPIHEISIANKLQTIPVIHKPPQGALLGPLLI
jgi:hypothetical protein